MERTKTHESQYASSLIEASLDPLIVISTKGIITDLNQAKVTITGIEREKLIGTNFYDYFTEPLKAREVYREIFAKGSVSDSPLTFCHRSGKLTDVLFNGSVYKDSFGNVLGAVVVARDISEQKWAMKLRNANIELVFQNNEKGKRAAELIVANEELVYLNEEKEKRAEELVIANEELVYQNNEKEQRAAELVIANKELFYQNIEKEQRAEELVVANEELAYQNDEKGKRAAELVIANEELVYQNNEKGKRAAELVIANEELVYQNIEKEKRADELIIANKELAYQNIEKEKRADELIIANKELVYQNEEKEKRAAELKVADKELVFQNDEKEKRAAELVIANEELVYQNEEKEKRAAELKVADKELVYQNDEKEKRAAELVIANEELVYQNEEKEKRAAELKVADEELRFQNLEKEKNAAQLILGNYARSLIEASLDPLFTINLKGKITDMNNASVKVTGVPREKLINTDFFNYFTEPEKAREVYQEVFAKGFVTDFPLTIRDGKLTDVLFNGSVYKDEFENVLGVVVVARDITQQKKIANELNEAIILADKATGIAEEAKSNAENAVKSKQQFLSNMSHEIRTPMNAIIGFTKVLLKTDLTLKQKEYLTAIKMSGDALIVLINDILDLAKVDSGKMIFEQIPFRLELSISAMLHVFEIKIQEKNLDLVKEYDNRIPEVLVGDPVRLHQIILNLVSNSIKFTIAGKITVSVLLLSEDDEKVSIEFSVTDTGIGIPANKIKTIFENFQQATSDTSRLYGGTGLGLAIAKQLVESQGGTISVKSKVNEGSTFSFILSFLKTNIDLKSETENVEIDTEIKNIKVLVAEDIPLNQLLMKTLLDDFGFERDIADNGKIVIEKLQQKSYDIILMDLQMPLMNGFEATDYIRKKMNSKIPIIALTADVTTVDLAKCKAVGINDYISKPVDERLLYDKIIGLVKKSEQKKYLENEINLKSVSKQIKYTDLHYLIKRTKSNSKLMMEMISLYLEQTPTLVKTMKQSLLNKDWSLLHSAVHKMIPSFSIVGINIDFENMARKVQEYASTQNNATEIDDMVLQLGNVCTQACVELKVDLNRIKNEKL
jgi:PAS domain S-box-containing protein